MAKVVVDLSHPFSAEIPRWPYFDKPEIVGAHSMAKGGVLTQSITCTMHTGTHCDAPRHVMEYEFDGKGNGCMCIDKTNHYEFTYDIDGDTLKVDYALDYVTDCEYTYTVDGEKLTLLGGIGTAEPGKAYELTKQE